MINEILNTKKAAWENSPLIHSITNPISINDCANFVLCAGAKPFMAEHPSEAAEVTSVSDALALNIANITDARLSSIEISAKTAAEKNIPSIIDIVGVGCSKLRYDYVKQLLSTTRVGAIKGNIAEIRKMLDLDTKTVGIDVAEKTDFNENIDAVKTLALKYDCVVMASGENDIISDGNRVYCVSNGKKEMSFVTGTGCILNVLSAVYMSAADVMTGCAAAAVIFGICGELADCTKGLASYRIALQDKLCTLTDAEINENIKLKILT